MKKLVLFTILVGVFSIPTMTMANRKFEFEILNKYKDPIWVVVINKDPKETLSSIDDYTAQKVDKGKSVDANIHTGWQTMLGIWLENPGTVTVETEMLSRLGVLGKKHFKPQPHYLFTFSQGSSVLVTFNPPRVNNNLHDITDNNSVQVLYPQTGVGYGIFGLTRSKKPLKDNIKEQTDIIPLK